MDKQNFSTFYSTLSPVGAAALLRFTIFATSKRQGKDTADLMMSFGVFILSIISLLKGFLRLFQMLHYAYSQSTQSMAIGLVFLFHPWTYCAYFNASLCYSQNARLTAIGLVILFLYGPIFFYFSFILL